MRFDRATALGGLADCGVQGRRAAFAQEPVQNGTHRSLANQSPHVPLQRHSGDLLR